MGGFLNSSFCSSGQYLKDFGNVTYFDVLGFPKIDIEGKPQKVFQTSFIKLMLKHEGGSTEERKDL